MNRLMTRKEDQEKSFIQEEEKKQVEWRARIRRITRTSKTNEE